VKTAWLGEQKVLTWQKAYKEMRAKYTVVLPGSPENQGAAASSPTASAPAASSPGGNRR
jgi:peptidyl-prolyl cis-trans isomerase C